MRNLTSPLVLMTLFCIATPCLAQKQPRLEIAGFSVAKKDPDSDSGRALGGFGTSGLQVDVYFETPGQAVVGIDLKQTKVSLKTEDGTELPLREQLTDQTLSLNMNEERNGGTIQLGSETLPGPANTGLSLNGAIVLTVGKDSKTEEIDLKVVAGTKVKLGLLDATVGRSGDDGDQEYQMIQLNAGNPFDSVSKIEFLDSKGEVIESYFGGSGSYGGDGSMTFQQSYNVNSAAKSLKLRVTYFSKLESLKLPLALKCGLGF